MMTTALTMTSKLFTLLAVACCVLGLMSTGTALADPPDPGPSTCDCGAPPTSTGAEWDAFVTCYNNSCSSCSETCGAAVPPGATGHDAWRECYSNCAGALACLTCSVPNNCRVAVLDQYGQPTGTFICNRINCAGQFCPGACFCKTNGAGNCNCRF